MKRLILFKAIVFGSTQWIEGCPYKDFHDKDNAWFMIDKNLNLCGDEPVSNVMTDIIPETLCQFTGQKDMNGSGKFIFEGDLFKHGSKKGEYGVVEFSDLDGWIVRFKDYTVQLSMYLWADSTRKTVGNINDEKYKHLK